ncbi:MAG TPA: GNAT family N-acetyltransferase [Acidobacteriaceae bacterium]|jgi:predicted N-acetyltransferase YhbS|nr:GNAT family N-acetyltransferase [Acidobacteriaceae bacterium]
MSSNITLRPATPADAAAAGQICFDAFTHISNQHGFPPDFPGPEHTTGFLSMLFALPNFFCIVAEADSRILGSNCLDERSLISGVGPITVDPSTQNRGVGHMLMHAVLDRARQQHAVGIRLVQAAFHNRSLSLYTSLGFDVREPLSCMQGRPRERSIPGCTVRAAQPADLDACNALSLHIHGFDRSTELAQSIQRGVALVVERAGRITGYASDLALFGHATAETTPDLQALLASAESFGGPGILIPSRNSTLFRWCLANGLRVVQPMTLMSIGLYNEPAGAWFPSILY